MKKKIESIKCKKCEGIQLKNNFYKPLEKQEVCKECLSKEFMFQYRAMFDYDFGETIEWMCKEYNLPFVYELIYYHQDISNINDKLERYINDISLLPMYQDSNDIKEKSDIDFINEDIRELKIKISNALQKDDFNAHNKWMNSLRDALELRDRLENNNKWEDMYSHYYEGREVEKGDNEYVATWKQKGEDIRNHKIYKVEKEVPTIRIEIDKNYIIDGDTLTIPIKVNDKSSCAIKGKKVDDKWVLESGTTIKCS